MTQANDEEQSFKSRFGPWALVAGASDGIGECFARQLAERGINLVLLARREALLEELAAELRKAHDIQTRVIVADLKADDLDHRVARSSDDLEIGLLVYNAGTCSSHRPGGWYR